MTASSWSSRCHIKSKKKIHRSVHDNNNNALDRIDLQASFYLYFVSGVKKTFKVKIAHNDHNDEKKQTGQLVKWFPLIRSCNVDRKYNNWVSNENNFVTNYCNHFFSHLFSNVARFSCRRIFHSSVVDLLYAEMHRTSQMDIAINWWTFHEKLNVKVFYDRFNYNGQLRDVKRTKMSRVAPWSDSSFNA